MDMLKEALSHVKRSHLLIALLIVIVFIGFSAARCSAVHAPQDTDNGTEQQEGQNTGGEADVEEAELSEDQQSLINSYDPDVQEMVNILAANTWTAQGETASLTFTDHTFTEANAQTGESSEHTYAVSSYEQSTSSETGANGESRQTTTRSAAILTDSGTYLLTMRQIEHASGTGGGWSVASNAFAFSESYVLSEAAQALSVTGISSDLETLIGGHADALVQAVTEHCARYYPTATEAAWSRQASVDWEGGIVTTSFKLNNSSGSEISVVYNMQTGGFTVD